MLNRLTGRVRYPWIILCVTIGLFPEIAGGQSKIPYGIVTTEAALTIDQKRKVEGYVDARFEMLLEGGPGHVAEAREELIEPFGWVGASEIFALGYSSVVSSRLIETLQSPDLLIRLNSMIIAASLNDSGVVRLIEIGVVDENPGLRYWAGKAVGEVGAKRKLSKDSQLALLAALRAAIDKEQSTQVLHRLLVGMVSLDIPEATDFLLDELDRRVATYWDNPEASMTGIIEVMRKMFIAVVQNTARGKPITAELRSKMSRVGFRYYVLASAKLDRGRLDPWGKRQHVEILELTDSILTWMVRATMQNGSARPGGIKSELEIENWPEIRLRAEEWRKLLHREPFKIDPNELKISGIDNI